MPTTTITKTMTKAEALDKLAALEQRHQPDVQKTLKAWSIGVLVITIILSMFANGWSNSQHAVEGMRLAAWLYGLAIPVIILGLSQIAGCVHKLGHRKLTMFLASVTLSMLILSIYEVQHAIQAMSGVHVILATLMAVGIDLSMVGAKLALVVESS